MPSLAWCVAYAFAAVASFAFFASRTDSKPRIEVVKVKVQPVLIEGPREVKR